MFWSHPAENGSPPALQTMSRPMYFGCDGHIQSKMADLQPSSHVREKSGAICKIHAKYSARAARSLAMQIRKSLPESHPRVTSMQISEDESHLSTSQSHPGVTSAKNSEASHIRWSHPRVTSGQNPVTSRGLSTTTTGWCELYPSPPNRAVSAKLKTPYIGCFFWR